MGYTVEVRAPDLTMLGQVSDWLRLEAVTAFNGVGTWTVSFGADSRVGALLEPGGGLVIRRNGDYLIGGPFRTLSKERSRDNPDGALTIAGVSYDKVLDRLAFPNPAATVDTQDGQAYHTVTGAAETVIRTYVNANAGPGALLDRRVPGLTLAADQARGTEVTGNADFDVLIELISKLALTDGLGWRVVPVGAGLQFQVYQPADLSGVVRFSWPLGNLTSYRWEQNAPQATREIVAGQGMGVWRLFRQTVDTAAEADWVYPVEHFIDRRDTNDDDLLSQAGTEALAQDAGGFTVSFQTIDTHGVQYGRDWNLGDKITVIVDGVEVSDVVREVTFTADAAGETVAPVIGPPGATMAPAVQVALRKIISAIQTQQRRR